MSPEPSLANTTVVLAQKRRDAELTCEFLRGAGVAAIACPRFDELIEHLRGNVGALMLTEEAIAAADWPRLFAALEDQPPWSDVPVILFTGARHAAADRMLQRGSGNLTIIETPVRVTTVVSAARSALRARRRQYEVCELLERQQDLVRRLEETDRRKDEFLAMLGHELRNPLSAIQLAAQMLQRTTSPERAARHVDVVERQARSLGRIVDDLLDVSRVTLGKIKLERQRVDLCDLARRGAAALEHEARTSRHALAVELPGRPVIVFGDVVRLEQVFSNLVTNAIKYTPPGGHIAIRVAVEGDDAIVRVVDDGIGMPPEVIAHVFELFTQGRQGLERSRGGLGLGLALVRRLIELHGGSIEAHSEGEGRGSELVFRIPLAPVEVAGCEAAAEPAPALGAASSLRVLIVEDNDDARDSLQDLLTAWSHEVEAVADGLAGLERALAGGWDVILLDIGLPKLDGYEIARQVRATDGTGRPRLIAMTGYGQPEDRVRAVDAGFDVHLVKPLDLTQLQRALDAVVP